MTKRWPLGHCPRDAGCRTAALAGTAFLHQPRKPRNTRKKRLPGWRASPCSSITACFPRVLRFPGGLARSVAVRNISVHQRGSAVGLAELDEEQLQLVASDRFWQLITARRKQPTVNRAELERMAAAHDAS